jgi:hypothetical protein
MNSEDPILLLTESDSRYTLQDMNYSAIERRMVAIKRSLTKLGPMHPGSLSEQYNVCGKLRCRCKDPQKPRRHGPYYQLSFTWRGKSTSRFVRPERVTEMRHKVENYKRFRELVNEWVDLAVELERVERVRAKQSDGD